MSGGLEFLGQLRHDLHRLHTDPHDLADEADDVLGIVVAVGIGSGAAAFIGRDLIRIDCDSSAYGVPQAIFKQLWRLRLILVYRFALEGYLGLAITAYGRYVGSRPARAPETASAC